MDIDTGVSLGAWVAGGTTGGHVNPVVCPAMRYPPRVRAD